MNGLTQAEETRMQVKALDQAVQGYLSVLEQQGMWWGWGNEVLAGMLVPYGVWHTAQTVEDGNYSRKLIYTSRANSVRTGRKGAPDVVGIFRPDVQAPGLFVGIEMKTGSAVQTPEQKYAQMIIERLGGIYILAGSVMDVEERMVPSRGRTLIQEAAERARDTGDIPF